MTRKDYELIAAAIKSHVDRLRAPDRSGYAVANAAMGLPLAAVEGTAKSVATALALDNPRFDRQRFMAACGF